MRDSDVHAPGHYIESDQKSKLPAGIFDKTKDVIPRISVNSNEVPCSGHRDSLRSDSNGMRNRPYAAASLDTTETGRVNGMLDHKDVDGGWAWVVCLASFFVNFILDGVMFSFGVILLELLEYFEDSKSKTAWVGSALLGFSVAVGPVVSLLLEFYSCRQVMILGSLISAFGFTLSFFAPNVETLIFTYGLVGGSGFGLSYVSAILVVGLHFNKKRALATGIAVSGSGCGTFAISYLTERLLEWYGWRGTMLILAGVVLNCCVCGALMRPLVKRSTPTFPCCPESSTCFQKQRLKLCDSESRLSKTSKSLLDCQFTEVKPFLSPPMPKPVEQLAVGEKKQRLFHSNEHVFSLPQGSDRRYKSDCHLHNSLMPPPFVERQVMTEAVMSPLNRQDIFYSGSIFNLPEYKKDPNMNSFLKSMTSLQYSDVYQSNLGHSKEYQILSVQEISFVSAHKELFCNPLFLMLLFVMTAWTGHSSVLTYVPDLAVSKGVSSTNAALLVSAVGVSNIAGRLFAGWLTNRQDVDSLVFYTVTICAAGLSSAMFPLCSAFPAFVVCCCVFGLCMAACVSLRTVVLADVLGVSKLTKSFGIVAFMQGIAFTIGPPISGALYDSTHSFLPPFLLAATMYMLSGITCAFVRPTQTGSCSAPCRRRGSDSEGSRSRDDSESTDEASISDV